MIGDSTPTLGPIPDESFAVAGTGAFETKGVVGDDAGSGITASGDAIEGA